MRKLKLGMHTYSLHLWGFGMVWFGTERKREFDLIALMDKAVEWGLDGLHITGRDLETKDDARLELVAAEAKKRGLYLEYNFSFNDPCDAKINDTLENAAYVCHKLGATICKYSLDVEREGPVYGSCMQPKVMGQLVNLYNNIKKAIPEFEKYNVQIALENHTETFADEVLWLAKAVNHPLVKVCVDTVNSFGVLEGPEEAIKKLAPMAICTHFCDHKLTLDSFGARFHGVAVGDGDIDCMKVLNYIREVSPMERINFEIEWDIAGDTVEVAREKQMDAVIRRIKYCREVLKIGREDELIG